MRINTYFKNQSIYAPTSGSQTSGSNINTFEIKDKDKEEKKSNRAIALLFATTAFLIALKIIDERKKHKTFKDFFKNRSFMDWNDNIMVASVGIFMACLVPEIFKKKDNNEKKEIEKKKFSLRENIGAGSLIVLAATTAVGFLDMVINFDGIFKKGPKKR